jgi:hypothetical protein
VHSQHAQQASVEVKERRLKMHGEWAVLTHGDKEQGLSVTIMHVVRERKNACLMLGR